MDYTTDVFEVNSKFKPMSESDYCKWLKAKNLKDVHGIETKKEYLKERFGFVVGEDRISDDCIRNLKCIESFYFDFYVVRYKAK